MLEEDDPITEDDRKLLKAFHSMAVQPKIDSKEDLIDYMKYVASKEAPHMDPTITTKTKAHHFPKISMFFGEDNKGEVNWQTFKFEIAALVQEKAFTEEQILLGIRRAAKGNAADVIRRLGIGVTIDQVMDKLESTFGFIESEETMMRKFYACQQEKKENVVSFAARVEEMFARAVAIGSIDKGNDRMLKKVFYQGLRPEIKQIAYSKCDTIDTYDVFKTEVRKIEKDLVFSQKEDVTQCAAATSMDKNKSELSEVKDLLKKLNDRIDRLERQNTNPGYDDRKIDRVPDQRRDVRDRRWDQGQDDRGNRQFDHSQEEGTYERYGQEQRPGEPFRGRGTNYRGRGYNNNNRGYNGRGYRPTRPMGANNMRPRCYNCNRTGHFARDCRDASYPNE